MTCVQSKQNIPIEDLWETSKYRNFKEKYKIPEDQIETYLAFTKELVQFQLSNIKLIKKEVRRLSQKYRILPSKSKIRKICQTYNISIPDNLSSYLIKKKSRSMSGVVVIAVTSPPLLSCSYNCSFCPSGKNESGVMVVPKSYDPKEPAIARGLRNNFSGILQFYERGNTYLATGHSVDKVEVIVRGGTWHCYPEKTQFLFITEVYYAANTFYQQHSRKMLSLDQEIQLNKSAKCRIIGLTLETRPDFGLKNFHLLYEDPENRRNRFTQGRLKKIITNLRCFGCTRIEFGIQHTDNDILAGVNRESTIEDAIYTIQLMKDCCFKIVGHWMPDLPGSSYEQDVVMMDRVIQSPELQLDDWKIYPTATTRDSDILDWYNDGTYMPYSEVDLEQLIKLCIRIKRNVPKWIRIDRLTRDIPSTSMEAGYEKKTNLRQIVQKRMHQNNYDCRCLRCKEVRDRTENIGNAKLAVTQYRGSNGDEFFITYENCSCRFCWRYYLFLIVQFIAFWLFRYKMFWSGCKNYDILYGFCRLRLSQNSGGEIVPGTIVYPELRHSALVRELKVYGQVIPHFDKKSRKENLRNGSRTQHTGFGRRLMREAENIARYYRYPRISVINGIGTEEYYVNKLGYHPNRYFVTKNL